jgi:hypothetical protein
MAKEWANKDKYHSSNDVLEPRVQMPRAKASVRTVPAWGERKAAEGAAGRVVWTSLGPLPQWVPGRLLGGPLGLLGLCHTAPDGVRRKEYGGEVLG